MSTKGTLPYAGINVPDSFSLAGFQVTTIGRIWVTAEAVLLPGLRAAIFILGMLAQSYV